MKYIYMILTMLSLTVLIYPENSVTSEVQYYDMSEYEITITSEK